MRLLLIDLPLTRRTDVALRFRSKYPMANYLIGHPKSSITQDTREYCRARGATMTGTPNLAKIDYGVLSELLGP